MNATKSVIIMMLMAFAMNAKAQSATEFASRYNGQDGMNYQNLTEFVEQTKQHLEHMPANGAPGQMPPGMPSVEELKDVFSGISTLALVATDAGPKAMRMHGAVRMLEGYVPLIAYSDEAEEPGYEIGPDNVRRVQLPSSYRVPGFIYQAYGRVDSDNHISDLIIFNADRRYAMSTCVTGNMKVEDLRTFYGMQQMMRQMQEFQRHQMPPQGQLMP